MPTALSDVSQAKVSWGNTKFGRNMEIKSGLGSSQYNTNTNSAQQLAQQYHESNSVYIQGLPLDILEEEIGEPRYHYIIQKSMKFISFLLL